MVRLGNFKEITHREAREMVDCLGTALVSLLNLKGKRIAIIGENRYEWEIAYLSVVAGTGTVVPLDKALPENEIDADWILKTICFLIPPLGLLIYLLNIGEHPKLSNQCLMFSVFGFFIMVTIYLSVASILSII